MGSQTEDGYRLWRLPLVISYSCRIGTEPLRQFVEAFHNALKDWKIAAISGL